MTQVIVKEREAQNFMPDYGWVYLMHSAGDGLYKIGKSNEPYRRLREIRQRDSDPTVTIVRLIETENMTTTEQALHGMLEARNAGGEWFQLRSEHLKLFDQRARAAKESLIASYRHYQMGDQHG